jgi:hypothetical protein
MCVALEGFATLPTFDGHDQVPPKYRVPGQAPKAWFTVGDMTLEMGQNREAKHARTRLGEINQPSFLFFHINFGQPGNRRELMILRSTLTHLWQLTVDRTGDSEVSECGPRCTFPKVENFQWHAAPICRSRQHERVPRPTASRPPKCGNTRSLRVDRTRADHC